MTSVKKTLKLDEIRLDGGTQFRVSIDQPTVRRYMECMEDGDIFPPIEVGFDGENYWIEAGHHRYHALKMMGEKLSEVIVNEGTLHESRLRAIKSNNKHGKPPTDADREFAVRAVLEWEGYAEKSNYEIAKITGYSQPYIAKVRDPEAKARQDANRARHMEKKQESTNPISSAPTTLAEKAEQKVEDCAPDQAELEANELAFQADQDAMYKLLESDDALATAHAEIKRLNHINAQLEIRMKGLMNERNEAVKMLKKAQRENEKLKAQK